MSASCIAPVPAGQLAADYDNAVSRGPRAWRSAVWSAATSAGVSPKFEHKSGQAMPADTEVANVPGRRLYSERDGRWQVLQRGFRPELRIELVPGRRHASLVTESFNQLSRSRRPMTEIPLAIGERQAAIVSECWKRLSAACRPQKIFRWTDGQAARKQLEHVTTLSRQVLSWPNVRWQIGRHPAPGISDHSTPPVIPPDQYQPDPALRFSERATGSLVLLFNKKSSGGEATIVVPVRTIYMAINTQSVVLAETGQAIEARNIQLSIDADTWAWNWSADVPGIYESMLEAPIGEMVELVVTLNGISINLMVEKRRRNRSFAKTGLGISGRGKAAWLAEPAADEVSRSNSTLMTAQQIMAAVLTDNGAAIGWDIDWQLTDWTVPAGVWSHTGTAMEACLAIAQAAGGYIQADSTAQVLHVLPRYPVAPWDWSSVTPAYDIPEDLCTVEDIEDTDKARYNTVVVSGQAGGVCCHVTRAGTDGGTPAPMVVDSLITHVDAGRQNGLAVLADTGRQKIITVSMPVLPEIGIVMPGKFMRYRENGNVRIGLTRGVSVSANFPKIRQSVEVETHVL